MYTALLAVTVQLAIIAVTIFVVPALVHDTKFWLSHAAIMFIVLPAIVSISKFINREKNDGN